MKSIIVTGAGSGIGKASALDLARNGFHILCISQSKKAIDTANAIISDGGAADALVLDLSDKEKVSILISNWIKEKKTICYGVVLAAGVLGPKGPLETSSIKEWDYCFQVNILGNLAVLQQVLPSMIKNGFGRIVFFGGGGAAYSYPLFPEADYYLQMLFS